MDDTTLCSIRNLCEYLLPDEVIHYMGCYECENPMETPLEKMQPHILYDVRVVLKWLKEEE